ncbi:phage head spike fiber domain-containing protein [Paraburkholderia sp.]|uniref:phage head spike fiber domain-containing protein n=1 Tax=Paraburkholderia sp. TaxID=1926495 RepID=UPI003C7EA7D7
MFGSGGKPQTQQPVAASGIRVQTSVNGRAIPVVYGVNRVSGNIIWYGNFISIPHTSQSSAGGKGGSGGNSTTSSYTYSVGFIMALSEGPIQGIGQVWQNSDVYSVSSLGLTFFPGNYPQAPSGWMSANYPSQALGYTGIAYIMHSNYNLGSSTSLPNLSAEVYGLLKADMSSQAGIRPDLIFDDLLTNATYGLSWPSSWLANYGGWAAYCGALGILFSPVFDTQTQVNQSLQDMLDSSNANCFWSEGVLKIQSYGDTPITANGYTFTPNITPVYNLTDDNFIFQEGQDPIQVTRSSPQDAYNVVQVECVDATQAYQTYIAEAKDQYSVSTYGPLVDTVRSYHHITNVGIAQVVAQTILQRDVYIRNTFTFKLGWAFCALEPMDLVTLTDSRMGMSNYAVRITQVEESSDGTLEFTAEEFPAGVATPATYQAQVQIGGGVAYNSPAPNVTNVGLYEPPAEYTSNQLTLWIAAGGIGNWGGCEVWVSLDNQTFVRDGVIEGGSRVGVLTAPLALGSDPDTTDTLSIQLANDLNNTLSGGTQADADNYRTLCVVGQELISYQNSVLTATDFYNLTYLRRGAYGTTIAAHNTGDQFFRVDGSVLSYPFMSTLIGQPIYLKFVSFNPYGGGKQTLNSVPTFTYTIKGSANNYALPNVTNLYTNFVSGITQLFWSPVTDFRAFDYEVRFGSSWGSATFLGRTSKASFATSGDGTYWVAAHFVNPNGVDIYSAVPAEVVVAGSILVQNVVASFDEVATSWPGTLNFTDSLNISGTPLVYRTDWQGTQLLYTTSRTNSVLNSQDFTQSSWVKNNATVTASAQTAPDGTNTAQTVTNTSTGGDDWVGEKVASTTGTIFSVFAKMGGAQASGSVELRAITWNGSTVLGDDPIYFNLSTQSITSPGSGLSSFGAQSMGNGWYRIWSIKAAQAGQTNSEIRFRPDAAQSGTVSGDTALFWGAQIENSVSLTSYIATTATAVSTTDYSITSGGVVTCGVAPLSGAQLTWTGTGTGAITGNPVTATNQYFGLGNGVATVFQITYTFGGASISSNQLTLQGSGNLLTVANVLTMTDVLHYGGIASSGSYAMPVNELAYSQDFTQTAWTKANCTVTANAITDPIGANTGQKLAKTATGDMNVAQTASIVSANLEVTASVYLQAGSSANVGAMVLRLKDGAGTALTTNTVTPVVGAWTRYSVTGTFPSNAVSGIQFIVDSSSTSGSAGDNCYAWGAQLEVGSVETAYDSTGATASPHRINAGKVANCSVRLSYTGYAQSITDNVLTVANILIAADMLDAAMGQYVTITPQIALAQANGVYGAWQNYQPGVYTAQYFKAQMLLTSSNPSITPLVTALTFAVDVPDRVETFTNQAIASGGTTLTYPNGSFLGGPSGAATPNVQVTVLSASQGDTVLITSKTLSQVTVQVLNGGVGVARTTDITVQGY